MGDDRLRWVPLPPARLRTTRARDGRIDFDRAVSPGPAVPAARITMPSNKVPEGNIAVPLHSSLLPLLPLPLPLPLPFSGAMAILLQSPYFRLFGILPPITFFATRRVEGSSAERKSASSTSVNATRWS
ncbi:hypothetical protein AB0K67_21865 [Nonomuraea sp. NPDC052634]|uniref:hypothetical protein n=1 Tax=Nonomuraea sp. NPDC052634 TaxID=3155813 RepID=UPI0034379ED3